VEHFVFLLILASVGETYQLELLLDADLPSSRCRKTGGCPELCTYTFFYSKIQAGFNGSA
jgi:hypothetical protein